MNGRIGNYVFSMGGPLSRTIISLQGSDVEIIQRCEEISSIAISTALICAPLFVVSFHTHPRTTPNRKYRHNGSFKETLLGGARPAIARRKGKEKTPK